MPASKEGDRMTKTEIHRYLHAHMARMLWSLYLQGDKPALRHALRGFGAAEEALFAATAKKVINDHLRFAGFEWSGEEDEIPAIAWPHWSMPLPTAIVIPTDLYQGLCRERDANPGTGAVQVQELVVQLLLESPRFAFPATKAKLKAAAPKGKSWIELLEELVEAGLAARAEDASAVGLDCGKPRSPGGPRWPSTQRR
jgi:hypothetical protein